MERQFNKIITLAAGEKTIL